MLHEAIATYAAKMAGTRADLEPELEIASLELWRPSKKSRRRQSAVGRGFRLTAMRWSWAPLCSDEDETDPNGVGEQLEIGLVRRDDYGAVTSCREGDERIVLKVAAFRGAPAVLITDVANDPARLPPVSLGRFPPDRSEPKQTVDEILSASGPSAPAQFGKNDRLNGAQ